MGRSLRSTLHARRPAQGCRVAAECTAGHDDLIAAGHSDRPVAAWSEANTHHEIQSGRVRRDEIGHAAEAIDPRHVLEIGGRGILMAIAVAQETLGAPGVVAQNRDIDTRARECTSAVCPRSASSDLSPDRRSGGSRSAGSKRIGRRCCGQTSMMLAVPVAWARHTRCPSP